MKFAQLILLILAFLIIKPASAGVLIEPVLGYSAGKFEIDNDAFDEEKFAGPSIGGRLGYQNLGLQLGVDYLQSTLDVDDNDFKDLKTKEWAGFVGFEFPILIRVYAGYIFSAEGKAEVNDTDIKATGGTGPKFGVGFTGLPFVDINFEMRRSTFDEIKIGGTKLKDETTFSAYMISLSLPFVL